MYNFYYEYMKHLFNIIIDKKNIKNIKKNNFIKI